MEHPTHSADSDPVLVEWTAPPPTQAELKEALVEIERLLELAIFGAAPLAVLFLMGSSLAVGWATGDGYWLPITLGLTVFALGPMIGLYAWLRVGKPQPSGASRRVQLRRSGAWVNGRLAWASRAITSFELKGEQRVILRFSGWGTRSIELRLDPASPFSLAEALREAFRTLGVPELIPAPVRARA